MEQTTVPILEWLKGNWGWVISAFCVFFEITPIKLHPISAICKWIGDRLTSTIKKDIADLRKDVDMARIAGIKAIVLDFANSCRNGRKHSKEEFTNILSENSEYERLVKKYDLKNDVYREDFNFILEIYRECLHKNSFLA